MNVAKEYVSERKNALYAFTNELVLAAISLDIEDLPQAEESIKRASDIKAYLPLLPVQHERFSFLSSVNDARQRRCITDMNPAILILGPDGSHKALERLHVIRDAVPNGIETTIVKEIPDCGVEPVMNKVWRLVSQNINTIVLMECSQPSGHLNEFEALKSNYPMALFRQKGKGDTYMTVHEPLYQTMMMEYEYKDLPELRKSVVNAVDWGVRCLLRSQSALRIRQPWLLSPIASVTKSFLLR